MDLKGLPGVEIINNCWSHMGPPWQQVPAYGPGDGHNFSLILVAILVGEDAIGP